ncbi:MAG: hypothetical protein ACKPKO_63355, partial [Candidatus Fonsibacter sp.]
RCIGISVVSVAKGAGHCEVCLGRRGASLAVRVQARYVSSIVQHAACKLLVGGALGNASIGDGGQTLLERSRKSLPWLLDAVRSWALFPLGGHSPNASEHARSEIDCSGMLLASGHLQYAALSLETRSASDVPSQ